MPIELKQLQSKQFPTWCPGCGDYGIWMAIKQAMTQLDIPQENYVLVSGIGCGSKMPHWVRTFGLHTLHGRPAPVASGIKLANHKLTVIIIGGDGDSYGIGLGHFTHLMRRNYDLLYIVENNQVYGLTTGQTSPTSDEGYCSISTPHGVLETPINPISLSISAGATWVGRSFSGDIKHLTQMIMSGIQHKGTAFLDILQPCVTFNKKNTYQWYQERVHRLGEGEDHHKVTDKLAALKAAESWEKKINIGVYYEEKRPTYEEGLPQLKKGTLVEQSLEGIDVKSLLDRLK
ncbi:MAG: pyruvate ferredoxin/flavodoxin oxidoreductase subunit beta, 2-oxoglutarate ferredoxin oxidoreductase subunit beta [Candidatus Peregrinibacteria bacterium GW2011_GWE2_39_6]|nr:MAG: pyruvate ferredoxin/flavodoxin oxidoreductase subunit beta, 2-oxoglutarate ferredoxin oxidoreductase subunit beta [Candidatus Peregrinibacteria bacterium GW2011_GWF2_39_17]KKR25545.1 MAG: pyruvate ferredoxin/flavodoxin oxidoreductase subunit beta, 2-oxoglutarate ferredoxin oxidoreductase subunit beta [Candidatus Peregrinibacteria bacterium GW2011_GWE2_39_6]HCW32634.1 2-oxoacid ferredoxin oxidoreductase [Candidatus Peregrinibacteria bacterium]